ncbi:MAG: hypothetical protein Q9181_000323 [Wetmoreana brouardii]
MSSASHDDPLSLHLNYKPVTLQFGTSDHRGEVVHLTQVTTRGLRQCGIRAGDDFSFAHDLRPSSTDLVEGYRGGLSQAVKTAVIDKGMHPINLGAIPTPALTYWALRHAKGSTMVTGRNAQDRRKAIGQAVQLTRASLLLQSYAHSPFDFRGVLRTTQPSLLPIESEGRSAYLRRYLDFFNGESLQGMDLLVYQHSAVGRDLLVEILQSLGAKVTRAGRSDVFVPIDSEAIDDDQLETIQTLCQQSGGPFDAVLSTDGDSDRPLLVAPDGDGLRFFGGDLLGMIVVEFLNADAVVVPISTNDAIDRGSPAQVTEPKTKIGSPYVMTGMQDAFSKGRRRICGWEANGGFLVGSNIDRHGNILTALPTRDAVLPLLCAFVTMNLGITLPELFATLPKRFSRAALIRKFPRSASLQIVSHFSLPRATLQEVFYHGETIVAHRSDHNRLQVTESEVSQLSQIRQDLQKVFSAEAGFTPITRINYIDGVRLAFENGYVAHFRPSENADELRIYTVADSQERADAIVAQGVAEPDGLLRRLERMASLPSIQ